MTAEEGGLVLAEVLRTNDGIGVEVGHAVDDSGGDGESSDGSHLIRWECLYWLVGVRPWSPHACVNILMSS